MSTVIDASALIAFLRDEPGADVVETVLSAPGEVLRACLEPVRSLLRLLQGLKSGCGRGGDSLVSFDRLREQRSQEEQLVRTLEDTVRLSELRYRGGLDSYLQVLDAQRNLFTGQLSLAQLRLQERVSVVQLYRALGGGWS